MDLSLVNLQLLICHKTKAIKHNRIISESVVKNVRKCDTVGRMSEYYYYIHFSVNNPRKERNPLFLPHRMG